MRTGPSALVLAFVIVGVPLATWACSPTGDQSTSPSPGIISASIGVMEITLPPDKLQKWEQQGTYDAYALEEASVVAGYRVVTPSFIPPGYQKASGFIVMRLGAGLPDSLKPAFTVINVQQMWARTGDSPVWLQFTQADHQFAIAGGQPVVINGHHCQKSTEQQGGGRMLLELGWSDGTLWYSLVGVASSSLDEASLLKVATSIP